MPFTLDNVRGSTTFVPFAAGCVFLLIILVLVVAIGEPTPPQFQIFRIIIALAGGAFAVSFTGYLDVQIPVLKSGYIKAGAGAAVFVILYFFSPAGLIVDEKQVNVDKLWKEYADDETRIGRARDAVVRDIFAFATPGEEILREAQNPNRLILESAREYVRNRFEDRQFENDFQTAYDFFARLFSCIELGRCDVRLSCQLFFSDVEKFRWNYCERLQYMDATWREGIWRRFATFAERTCRTEYLLYWVQFDSPEEIEEICIPTQCWALNVEPPYPCDLKTQFVAGLGLPE